MNANKFNGEEKNIVSVPASSFNDHSTFCDTENILNPAILLTFGTTSRTTFFRAASDS